jgi:hypothetical protein
MPAVFPFPLRMAVKAAGGSEARLTDSRSSPGLVRAAVDLAALVVLPIVVPEDERAVRAVQFQDRIEEGATKSKRATKAQ